MDWLSDFGHWLLVSDGGWWVGSGLIIAGIIALSTLLVWRYGDVRMGPDPTPPRQAGGSVYVWSTLPPPPANYHREDWYPLAGEVVRAVDVVADATAELVRVLDLTETVELRPVDPLDATVELETVDPSVPLFYAIRRPAPLQLETHTQQWDRGGLLKRIRGAAP